MDKAKRKKLEESGYVIASPEEFHNFYGILLSAEEGIKEGIINNIQNIRKELNIDVGVFIIPA